jgi:hypothetical protein
MGRDRSEGGGFILLWRSWRDHQCHFTNERRPATRQEAIEDLWTSAAYEDQKLMSRGQVILVERGQVLTSILALSKRWRWSRDRVRRLLALCEGEGEIEQKTCEKRTVITLCNYRYWQDLPTQSRHKALHLTDTTPTPDRHVEQSKPSEPTNNNPPPPPPALPANRAEASDADRLSALALIGRCQHHAELAVGYKIADFDALGQMVHLRTIRDDETIDQVFERFAQSRRKPGALTFRNFFRFYDDHETLTVKAIQEEKTHDSKAKQAFGTAGNGNGKD